MLKKFLHRLFYGADRVLNTIFRTEYNPLYRSGTIAVLLIMLTTVTGLVLVFYYRLGEPWESVQTMQNQVWLGRWLRSIHRHASDATVVAVIAHLLRMFAQGKNWGPRTFSWLTGVLLFLFLFVSAWTGFVLVWDTQAQLVAVAGARIVDSLGILADPIQSSFSGITETPPESFFFLNLFLHVVVPLGMIFGMWVHTSKMARATWFPKKPLLYGITLVFVVLGLFLPAPLGPKANLLVEPVSAPLDRFFQFWLPLSKTNPQLVFWLWVAGFAALASVPWVFRPKKTEALQPAENDPKLCQGCTQCVQDCPYEAITMVPRMAGPPVSAEVAQVISSLCVSCGLCSASCAPMTMGPPERKGTHQYQKAKAFVAELDKEKIASETLVLACESQGETVRRFEKLAAGSNVHLLPVECPATLHMAVVEFLAKHFGRVVIASCPERNCTNKDGHFLLRERLSGNREPGLLGRVPAEKIALHPVGAGEERALWKRLEKGGEGNGRGQGIVAVVAGVVLLLGIAFLGRGTAAGSDDGILRLNWRLSGQSEKVCTTLGSDATKNLPAHMKAPESCRYTMLSYRLMLKVDGKPTVEEIVKPGGFRHDRPLYVTHDLKLPPGRHRVELSFEPEKDVPARKFSLDTEVNIAEGRIALVYMASEQDRLLVKEAAK